MEAVSEMVTMQIGDARLTVPTESLVLAWLKDMLAGATLPAAPVARPPRIGAEWPEQGGIYAGIMRGEDGEPDHHLIVPKHPDAEIIEIAWGGRDHSEPDAQSDSDGLANTRALCASSIQHPAAEWAAGLVIDGLMDFYLPARRELSLCFANVPELFDKAWHWSSTQYAPVPDLAWGQHFDDGFQGFNSLSATGRARAVRRLTIQ